MGDMRISGQSLVNQELHRPQTARAPEATPPPPPDAAKLALVHQELHRPPTSLQATPGNGPEFGFNPALELGRTRDVRDGAIDGVDALIQRAQQAQQLEP